MNGSCCLYLENQVNVQPGIHLVHPERSSRLSPKPSALSTLTPSICTRAWGGLIFLYLVKIPTNSLPSFPETKFPSVTKADFKLSTILL